MKGRLALDTSAIIELVFSTPCGKELQDLILKEEVEPHTTEIAETELRYVLCRRLGEREADERVWKLRSSGYLLINSISELVQTAAHYKCRRALSLADCFCLAQAKILDCRALFAYKENEMAREMAKHSFDVDIIFLHD